MKSHQDLVDNYANSRSAYKQYDINKKRKETKDIEPVIPADDSASPKDTPDFDWI